VSSNELGSEHYYCGVCGHAPAAGNVVYHSDGKRPLCPRCNASSSFGVGDLVEKFKGDYQLSGEVRAVFTTRAGKTRYVVEHTPGFLHIYSGEVLRKELCRFCAQPLPNCACCPQK